MKNLHQVHTANLLDFLKVCWPESTPIRNDNGTVSFWTNGRLENTMPENSWDTWYARWLERGAPQDRNLTMGMS